MTVDSSVAEPRGDSLVRPPDSASIRRFGRPTWLRRIGTAALAASCSLALSVRAPAGHAESAASAASAAPSSPAVTEVERYASRDAARIVLRVSQPVRFERGSPDGAAEAGPRLYVDLPGAA